MPTYNVKFYANHPGLNGFTSSGTFVYTGSANTVGTATITDNEAGIEGQTLDDDSNGGETATADVTVGGNTSINTTVDAEISWLIRDDLTGQTFNVVHFDVEQGPVAGGYTLSEMKLFPGRSYTVLDYNSNPYVNAGDPVFTYSEFVCFGQDTLILTPKGPRPVQSLRIGDLVETLDSDPQPLIWVGKRSLQFTRAPHPHKPIELKAGALGSARPRRTLVLSPQHRVLLRNVPGYGEGLGPAIGMAAHPKARQMHGIRRITYFSLMTPQHSLLIANGLAVESFYPGQTALKLLNWLDRLRIMTRFPDVFETPAASYGPKVRPALTKKQVEALSNPQGVCRNEKRQHPFSAPNLRLCG